MSARALARLGQGVEAQPRRLTITANLVALIAIVYAFAGLVGHDPWKADEAYTFGAIHEMIASGDWVVPRVAGVPFMEKPPLVHWVASATAIAFSPWLALHDAARLACALFVLVSVGAVGCAARLLWGAGMGATGALLALSAPGLLESSHLIVPDLPLMAGFAIAVLGFAGCARERRWGGAVLGAGAGIGFLAKGLIAPCTIAFAAALLPAAFPRWRTFAYGRQLVLSAVVAAPFLVAWPAALWMRSHELFMQWFWENNVGRFTGFSVARLGAAAENGFWLQALPWFVFPLWLLVACAAWRDLRGFLDEPAAQIGLVLCAVLLFVLATAATSRVVYALPLIPPLAVAATGVVDRSPAWLERSLRAISGFVAVAVIAMVWIVWGALVVTGHAPALVSSWFTPHFDMPFSWSAVTAAAALTLGFAMVYRLYAGRALVVWVASLALAWALPATLWMRWMDSAKSYRAMFESMADALPAGVDCVGTMELGESERAMMHYLLGIETISPERCHAFVRQSFRRRKALDLPGWDLVWAGSRPGDERERFELYVRPLNASSADASAKPTTAAARR